LRPFPCNDITPMMQRIIRYWSPVLVWCAVIFIQSANPVPDVIPKWPLLDKVIHVGIYGLLSGLISRALYHRTAPRQRPLTLIVLATVITALYGLSDEWHQSFVAGRSADVFDWLADIAGGILGSALYMRGLRLRRAGVKSSRQTKA